MVKKTTIKKWKNILVKIYIDNISNTKVEIAPTSPSPKTTLLNPAAIKKKKYYG